MEKTFYLTTTLPYVNANLHMGHALEFVRADIIARYKKAQGFDVFFNTGTDEHGQKIAEAAAKAGKTPQEFVDESFEQFKESVRIFGLSDDIHFIRTTDKRHEAAAQEFWKRCQAAGFIYKKNYEAKYCVGCEETKSDSELVNGECPLHPGRPLEIIQEENYFFRYSAFTEKLAAFYASHPDFVVPDFRYNEIKAFIARGLEDFSISRLQSKMSWGIPVPNDPDHVMYVWFDALTNYISTLGWPNEEGDFRKYWIQGTPTQYCGKDNLRFQSAMWQAMLMAAGIPNSHQIIINGFITADGGVKMSKSLGNVVDPQEISAEFGIDALRFFLAKEVSSFEDSPFSYERFKAAYNAHLANGLGNVTSRILTLSERHLDKNVSEKIVAEAKMAGMHSAVADALDAFNISAASHLIWDDISALDKKISDEEVFKVVKVDLEKARMMLQEYLAQLAAIARALEVILPATSHKILDLIYANKKPLEPLFLRKE